MDGLHIAEAIARIDGVLFVEFDAIVIIQGSGDSTLRVFR